LSSYTQIGQNHLHFKEIDSTNTYASNLLAKTTPIDGTVISADYQSTGKGQFDRKWLSNRGENLIMSIILLPNFLKANEQIFLNMAIALAIKDYLNDFNNGFSIKWPNDIYYNDSKIAGILIQNQLQGELIKGSVVGIGLNLNQIDFDPLVLNPTSLKKITGQDFTVQAEMHKLWMKIENRYNSLMATDHFIQLKSEFEQNMYGINKAVKYKYNDQTKEEIGTIKGINIDGKLLLQNDQLQDILLVHGEAQLIYR
jgi:BirA family transcriptional regulator, biotin operon repressor / biotin---[acetyl-CoA-carboxylase] ligase